MQLGIDGTRVHTTVGFAVIDQSKLLIGNLAQQNAKLLPRWTNNRFWNQLSTDNLSNATSEVRHHADLAFAHLEDVASHLSADALVLAIPAFYDKAQLGLLLGMCKEAGLPVTSLVDMSLLAIANQVSHPTAMYLDVGLHRITLTALRTDGAIRQTGQQTIAEMGLATFWDRWASLVAEQFIQSSRFDPMHEAASEQKLFNQIPAFMANSAGSSTMAFELDLGNIKRSTTLSKDQLLGATSSVYPSIVQNIRQLMSAGEPASLFVSNRFSCFPDLAASLALIPQLDICYLDEDHILQAGHELWDRLGTAGDNVPHITTLALTPGRPAPSTQAARATHLLVGQNAYPMRKPRQIISAQNGELQEGSESALAVISLESNQAQLRVLASGIKLNGALLDTGHHLLSPGDVIDIKGDSAQVIAER
tara:strand:- start:13432 stop:14694 length:1263 start_codon:yes stop_codon:yes gene_type:complete